MLLMYLYMFTKLELTVLNVVFVDPLIFVGGLSVSCKQSFCGKRFSQDTTFNTITKITLVE